MEEAVSCVIFSPEKDKVLLIKRRDIPVWVLPGGGIEEGENPDGAAIREVLEETGLKVNIERKVAKYIPKNRLTKYTHFYECIAVNGEIKTGNETRDIDYFPVRNLPKRLVPFYAVWIKDALRNESHTLEKTIEKTSYWTFAHYLLTHPLLVFQFLLTRMGIHWNR